MNPNFPVDRMKKAIEEVLIPAQNAGVPAVIIYKYEEDSEVRTSFGVEGDASAVTQSVGASLARLVERMGNGSFVFVAGDTKMLSGDGIDCTKHAGAT